MGMSRRDSLRGMGTSRNILEVDTDSWVIKKNYWMGIKKNTV